MSAEPTLSWADQEVLGALRRLARAQAQVAAAGSSREPVDPALVDFGRRELAAAWAQWRDVRASVQAFPDQPAQDLFAPTAVTPPRTAPRAEPDIDLTTPAPDPAQA
jgi:hypothetical protein